MSETKAPTTPPKRIGCIDGLKGLAALWILGFHFLLAFAPYGHVGFGSGIDRADALHCFMSYYPYSCLVQAPLNLYLFFALIAYTPTLRYLKQGNRDFITKQAVTRYFRLMPAVLAGALMGYAAFAFFGGCDLALVESLRPITGAHWLGTLIDTDLTWSETLRDGLYGALFFGTARTNSVLWCMPQVFFGSYLTYAVLLMFGRLRHRWVIYAVLFGLSFFCPPYAVFLAGIAAADFSRNARPGEHNKLIVALLLLLGLFCGFYPHVLLPAWLSKHTLLAIAAFLFLMGFARSRLMIVLTDNRFFRYLGAISFGILLVQFPVLLTFSARLYLLLTDSGLCYPEAAALTCAATLPVVLGLGVLFYHGIERPVGKLCNRVFAFFAEQKN